MTQEHKYLKALVYKGAEHKKLDITDTVLDRISYELSIIEKQGFTNYFILYSRIVEICNELNLVRSFGRGSAANSIVNYCLDISKINPIEENLIFERFINPNQKQLPDIDIDIPKGYQKNVIERLKQKYSEYNIFYIAFIPKEKTDYANVFNNNTAYKKHQSGIIITTEKITNSTFQYEEQDFYLVLDVTNDPFYFDKIDIIELEYLNRLQLIIDEVGMNYHPYMLPLNDKEVFNFFVSGDLENIFQFNISSLNQILSDFKPQSINDLSIINAMFRPGLVDYIPAIIRNKLYNENYFCPSDIRVSQILEESYGLLIYQETFLHLAKEVAGISFSEAELWRRKIMRDKSNTEVNTFYDIFLDGCRKHSFLNGDEILSLANMIREMLPSTFQKSHSLSYSIIGYWGAFYKTHFRTQFDSVFNKEPKFQPFELY